MLKKEFFKIGKPVNGTVGQAASKVRNYSQNLLLIGKESEKFKN